MEWWRNRNLQKNERFFTLFANAIVQSDDSSFYLFAAGKNA